MNLETRQNLKNAAACNGNIYLDISDDDCNLSDEVLSEGSTAKNELNKSDMSENMTNSALRNKGRVLDDLKVNCAHPSFGDLVCQQSAKSAKLEKSSLKHAISENRSNEDSFDFAVDRHSAGTKFNDVLIDYSLLHVSLEDNTNLKSDIAKLLKCMVKSKKMRSMIARNMAKSDLISVIKNEPELNTDGFFVSMKHIEGASE